MSEDFNIQHVAKMHNEQVDDALTSLREAVAGQLAAPQFGVVAIVMCTNKNGKMPVAVKQIDSDVDTKDNLIYMAKFLLKLAESEPDNEPENHNLA